MQYQPCLSPLDGFAQTIQQLQAQGVKGCNVTVPFKQEAAELATNPSPRVKLAQAANTLRLNADGSIDAENTDGLGLVHDIEANAKFLLRGKNILLLGAGGAAAGALASLIESHPKSITVINRTISKAQTLVQAHTALAQTHTVALQVLGLDALIAPTAFNNVLYDVLINATATSLQGAALNLPPPQKLLHFGALVYDMMYGAAAKPFLDWSQSQSDMHAITARDGLGMLVEQAAQAFYFWRGIYPNGEQVLTELRQHLAEHQ